LEPVPTLDAEADVESEVEVAIGTPVALEDDEGPEPDGLDDDVPEKMGPDAPDPPEAPRATKEWSAEEGPDRFWFDPFESSTL